MVMSYEQWEIILGIVDQKEDLSKDNVIEKIKELLIQPLWIKIQRLRESIEC